MQYLYFYVYKKVETTGTFKYQKNKLKEEAFNPSKTSERLLALLPVQAVIVISQLKF